MSQQESTNERYQRQILLKGFGEEGQRKLLQAKVLVIGAGGLGCPALQYLAAAGVGTIGIVDDDSVALHNLHRQVLFNTQDVGVLKTEAAAKRLQQMNPDVSIKAYPVRLTNQNALTILGEYDLVVDGSDNFATRYLVNDASVLLQKPLVYGAISQYEGQVAVFNVAKGEKEAVNYRDLFPEPPEPGSVLNCAEAGVLGVLPGIIGTLQATEVLKLITGVGQPLINQLFTYNALTSESYVFALAKNPAADFLLPKTGAAYEQTDYEWFCEGAFMINEIDAASFDALRRKENVFIIDVREEGEQPEVTEFSHAQIPLSVFDDHLPPLAADNIVLFCQSGKRSREAARRLSATFGEAKKIYSLLGGILQWKAHGDQKA